MAPPDRTLASRFELKYWLHPSQVRRVREAIARFAEPDEFARLNRGYTYTISSLYLDSPTRELYRTTVEGHLNRFKLRMRTYSDEPDTPVFLEIKRRANQAIHKVRAAVPRARAHALLRGESLDMEGLTAGAAEFVGELRRLNAGPWIRVRYKREAYESKGHDPVRVTFDSDVMHKLTRDGDLSLGGDGWSKTPTEGVILEIKFTDNYPQWVAQLIRQFSLESLSIPKYVLSLDAALSAIRDTGRRQIS